MVKLRPPASVTAVIRLAGPPGSSAEGTFSSVKVSRLPFLSSTLVGKPSWSKKNVVRSGRVSAHFRAGSVLENSRRYRWTPAGSSQYVVLPEVTPSNRCNVPSPSTKAIHFLLFPAWVSALLGWTSSGSPNRSRLEIDRDQLFPTGDRECSSREL